MSHSSQSAISAPVVWHAQEWGRLYTQLAEEQLPHALLISGVEHTGKARFAEAFARLLLCEAPVAGHNCGQCHACQLSEVGNHGDLRWVTPEEPSRAIKISQIRDVIDFCSKTAGLGKRKVVVFMPAENMNASSANALLKSLEEPPANTYMILVAHRVGSILATVRSRCRKLVLPSPTSGQCVSWLNQLTGKQETSEKLLTLAGNRPLLAAKYYDAQDAEISMAVSSALDTLVREGTSVPKVAALLGKLPFEEALQIIDQWLQDSIRCASQDKASFQQGSSNGYFVCLDEVQRIASILRSGSNPNPSLMLEVLLTKMRRELGA